MAPNCGSKSPPPLHLQAEQVEGDLCDGAEQDDKVLILIINLSVKLSTIKFIRPKPRE